MNKLFASATLKLTSWYLLILMTISLLFSGIIYSLSLSEISTRLDVFESRMERMSDIDSNLSELGERQLRETTDNLIFALATLNLAILVFGGIGSYKLARKSLEPIEAAHDAQSRFTSDASHELRTPLAVMKSELEVALRDETITKSELHSILESNLEEVNRLSDLSTALLELSRYEASELTMEKVQLGELLEKVSIVGASRTNRITLQLPKKPVTIIANPTSIAELCVILTDNALRYSPIESKVLIKLSKRRGSPEITIENTGPGIAEEHMPRIFDRFYRIDSARSGNHGYGLGLSLAKRIADLHGATITISSQPNIKTAAVITF